MYVNRRTIWLTQEQCLLFGTQRAAITKHKKYLYSKELDEKVLVPFEHTTKHGALRKTQLKKLIHNLDA
jgi:hypothetical protein